MENQSKFYINGAWVNPMGSETIEVINPSDESVIGTIAAGTKEDIDTAVAAASSAFNSFSFSSKEDRIKLIEDIITEYDESWWNESYYSCRATIWNYCLLFSHALGIRSD